MPARLGGRRQSVARSVGACCVGAAVNAVVVAAACRENEGRLEGKPAEDTVKGWFAFCVRKAQRSEMRNAK